MLLIAEGLKPPSFPIVSAERIYQQMTLRQFKSKTTYRSGMVLDTPSRQMTMIQLSQDSQT